MALPGVARVESIDGFRPLEDVPQLETIGSDFSRVQSVIRSALKRQTMTMSRRRFVATSVASAALLQQKMLALAPTGDLRVTVDATKVGEPVSPLIFGGYMEPATTRVWAEMLTDRKFGRSINDTSAPPQGFNAGRAQLHYWKPVGPAGNVAMDKVNPFVGDHTPHITLNASEPHGIQQEGIRLGKGKTYEGRIYLKGDPSAKVVVKLVWGQGANDSQTVPVTSLTREYQKIPLKFTATVDAQDARLEIAGTGSGSFHVGTVSLMPSDNVQGFRPGMVKLFKDAGYKMAKWPGGNFVSQYDWRDGLGDRDKRLPRARESNDVGLHEFFTFCNLIGAEPDLAIDSGYGDDFSAAQEVEYVNGAVTTPMGKLRAANGHPEPFKVRLWCIGNEMYGFWQAGHMSANQYAEKHVRIVKAMKKVDPTIKVTSAGATPSELSMMTQENKQFIPNPFWPPFPNDLPYKFGSINDYDWWLLKNGADQIDYISEHTYAYPELSFDEKKQLFVDLHDPLETQARRMTNRMGQAFEAWDIYKEKMPELQSKKVKFIFDEWGTRFPNAAGTGMTRRTGMVLPMSYALFLHEMFRHSDMIEASTPTASFNHIVLDETGDGVGHTAGGLVIKIMHDHFAGARPVQLGGNSPQPMVSGTTWVDIGTKPTGSPTYPIDVVAAFSADRKKFIVSVVNPTVTAQEFSPQITGVNLRGTGKLSQLAAPSVEADNEFGKEPLVKIVESPQSALSGKVQVPPISVSVYEFDV
jgi:alpha-N-arabinofuranosidase